MNDSGTNNGQPLGSTSSGLLARVRANDPQAWNRLTQLYGPLVYRWARQQGLQASDASDVTQEVFQAVSGNIGRFQRQKEGDSFRGWLWTITRNKIHDHYRRASARPNAVGGSAAHEMLQTLANTPSELATNSFDTDASLTHRAVELARAEFEDKTWRAFWRTAIDGQKASDVAEELDMTPAAVYMAKSRVFRRLRTELDGLLE